jgi:hypothetical protein
VTDTAVGVAEQDPVVVVVGDPGQVVFVAVAYGPVALVASHTLGTLAASLSPHDAGTLEPRRAAAVKSDANDQVRSLAESGEPSVLLNCSAREPSVGVYFSCIFIHIYEHNFLVYQKQTKVN